MSDHVRQGIEAVSTECYLDFAQKQGYLNTHRTEQVDIMLESKLFGVMAVRVDKVNQSTLTEMCLIFPRAKIIGLTPSRKMKAPFGFNTYKSILILVNIRL